MIVVMKADATTAQIEHMAAHIASLGLTPQVIHGTHQTVIAALGEERPGLTEALEPGEGVEKVLPIMAPYKRASSELQARANGGQGPRARGRRPASRGDRRPVLGRERGADRRAGPQAQGAAVPRASRRRVQAADQPLQLPGPQGARPQDARDRREPRPAWRSSPRSWPPSMCRWSPNMRTCFRSARATCRTINSSRPSAIQRQAALLKRGMSATVDEFLLAAEYILDRGNPHVMLCERGIRTYEDHTRFTLPLATVPYLHDKSHLPVVVDPSHGTGKARLVAPMSKAAIAAGADALIIEVHDDPEHAASDGAADDHPRRLQAVDGSVPADRRGRRPDSVIELVEKLWELGCSDRTRAR